MQIPTDSIDAAPALGRLGRPPFSAGLPVTPPGPCRITFRGCPPSEPPRIEVRAWLARLNALTASMIGGDITIEGVDHRRKQGLYRVLIRLQMPTGAVVVGPDHSANSPCDDVYVAIRNAFRALRRELASQLPASAPGVVEATR